MKIGFAGLGIMGKPMSLNLLNAGFELCVWNRTSAKTRELRGAGADVAETLPDLAERCNLIITMLNDTPDVQQVLFGENGLADGLEAGTLVVDMTTISPEATEQFADKLTEMECGMLDAPVSGGDVGARKGTLTIMVGGDAVDFEKARPIFDVLGENIVHCGSNGDGQRVKMINQVLCGLHAVAMSEAFVLAEKIGLDLETMHRVVSSGAAGSWALDNYGPRVLQEDFSPGFKLGMQHKDLRIALETVQKLDGHFEGVKLAHDLFTRAKEAGMEDLGSHALVKFYRERTEV